MAGLTDEEAFGAPAVARPPVTTAPATGFSDAEAFGGTPMAAASASVGGLSDEQAFGGAAAPSGPSIFGANETLGDYAMEVPKGIAEGAKGMISSPLKGYGAAATRSERDSLAIMDRIDRGERIKPGRGQTMANLDPYGYQDMTAEQRKQFRATQGVAMARPVSENPLFAAGQAVEDFGKDTLAAPKNASPALRFTHDLSSGAGSLITGVATSLIPVAGVPMAGTMFLGAGMGQQYDDAIEKHATEEQALRAASLGSIAGATDLVDIALPALGTPGKVIGLIRRVGWPAVKSAFVEGGQEGLQQFIQNVIAKGIYNPSQDLTEAVTYNAAIGAILGAGSSAAFHGRGNNVVPTAEELRIAAEPPGGPQNPPGLPTDISSRVRTSPSLTPSPAVTPSTVAPATPDTTPTPGVPPQTPLGPVSLPPMSGMYIGADERPLSPRDAAGVEYLKALGFPPEVIQQYGPNYGDNARAEGFTTIDTLFPPTDPHLDPNAALTGPDLASAMPPQLPMPKTTTEVAAETMSPAVSEFLARQAPPLTATPEDSINPNSPLMEEIRSTPGANTGRLARLLGPKLYGDPSNMTPVSLKEMVQNSFDAIKSMLEQKKIDKGKIILNMDEKTRTISITDNGSGMTPQVLGKQFLEIAGTKKEGSRASGGLGIAKMLFLFGNKALHVRTMRDGKVAEMTTTGEALFSALEDQSQAPMISVRAPTAQDRVMFPSGHGTHVTVQVPATYSDPSTGAQKDIKFETSQYYHPVLTKSPLFDNIDVTLNNEPVENMGTRFPFSDYTQFSNVNFDWGTARIYVSKDPSSAPSYGGNAHILSNGLWQFDMNVKKNPREVYGDNVAARFYIDINPKVSPEEPGYPFDLNRQQFSKVTQEDFGKIFNYLSLVYAQADHAESVANFGNMQYLEYSPTGVIVGKKQKIEPKAPPPQTGLTLIKPGDKITVQDGKLIVNGRQVPELTKEDLEKFTGNTDALIVPQSEIDPHKVILHDNTDITISPLETKSVVNYAREKFGTRFDKFVFDIGNAFRELRNVVVRVMPKQVQTDIYGKKVTEGFNGYENLAKEGIGVSFDQEYRGVSIKVPFSGMFINPVLTEYNDVIRGAVGMVGTMVHELAHFNVRSHNAQFPAEMQRIIIHLDTNTAGFNFHAFKQKVVSIVNANEDIFTHLNGVFTSGNFTLSTRGKRFQDTGSYEAGNGGFTGDVAGPGTVAARGSQLSYWVAQSQAVTPGQSGRGQSAVQVGPGGSSRLDPIASTAANQRALDSESPGTIAVPRQPEVDAVYQRVAAAFANTPGGVPPAVQAQAAHADRMNRFYKWMAGLTQLGDANPRFIPLLKYIFGVRNMHNDESAVQDAALRVAKEWRHLGAQGENLTALINDITNMAYLSPQEVQQGIQRHPTQQEFNRLAAKHKVNSDAVVTYGKIKTMFHSFLTMVGETSIATAQRVIKNPVLLSQKIDEIRNQIAYLTSFPYFPFMNFGRHFVTVKDASGAIVSFQTFERSGLRSAEHRQMAFAKQMIAQYGVANVRTGTLSDEARTLVGMPHSLLADIKNDPDIKLTPDQKQALDMLLFTRSAQGSFAQRFKQKNYVPGYSMDFRRAFARYFFHGSRYYGRAKYLWQLRDSIAAAKAVDGNRASNIAHYMDDHLQNTVLDSTGNFGVLKGAAFFWALGYVPASATLNLTQTPMITLPFLAGKFGDVTATRAIARAMTKLNNFYRRGRYDNATDFEMRALGYGIQTGRISETQAPQLAGMAQGSNLLLGIGGNAVQRGWVHFIEKSAWLFENAEQVNRRVAYRAALDLAMRQPNSKFVTESVAKFADEIPQLQAKGFSLPEAKAIVTAAHTVDQTQFVYAKYARSRLMRGRLGIVFIFKQYIQSLLWMLAHNKSDVLPRYMIMAIAMGGVAGVPGYDDLKDILQALGTWLFKKHFNLDLEIRKMVLQHTNGAIEPDLILHGLARRGFGMPAVMDMLGSAPGRGLTSQHSQNVPFPIIDRSRALSSGNILPIDIGKLLQPSTNQDKVISDETQRASGAIFGVGFNIYKAIMDDKHEATDPKRYERMVPRALGNLSKSYRAFTEYRERGSGGPNAAATIINYDPRDTEQMMEALALAGGYQPLRVQAKWDSIMAKAESYKFFDMQKSALLSQLFEARSGNNPREIESVQESIRRFNTELPDWARGKAITADTALKSLIMHAETKAHREAGVPMQITNMGISRHIDALFPEATIDVRKVR